MEDNVTAASQTQPAPAYEMAVDARYQISYEEDGVFVVLQYERGNGKPIAPQFLLFDLERRGIKNVNAGDLVIRMRKEETRMRIAEPMEEQSADATFAVRMPKDEMQAHMMTFAPVLEGAPLDVEAVKSQLEKQWNVTHGIDEAALSRLLLAENAGREELIALGKPAEDGKDGLMTLLFDPKHTFAPKIDESGHADFKDLDLFNEIAEGDPVAQIVPPTEGQPGYTVTGKEIAPKPGKEAKFPPYKHAAPSEDGLQLIAQKSGRVELIAGRIEVMDRYEVHGDADVGVGNIDFNGDVIIRGNIISELTIQATGSIEVHGTIEAAHLIAGKDIVLRSGIQGKGKGKLEAGGNIVARFIERAIVEAEGDLSADSVVHSQVVVKGIINMPGSRTRIIGGHVVAGQKIIVNTIGSPSNDQTTVEVHNDPQLRARHVELNNERGQLVTQLGKIDNILRIIPPDTQDAEKAEMLQRLLQSKSALNENMQAIDAEIAQIDEQVKKLGSPKVHVLGMIMPDVRLIINDLVYQNKQVIEYATFLADSGQVVFTSCELSADGR
ncbi:FapA family protein [Eubacteriales bacterium OttesenSCG-928-N14]|nr:FapA family protein [Eubacteriales bacterium OttesenSCG-928-N14]